MGKMITKHAKKMGMILAAMFIFIMTVFSAVTLGGCGKSGAEGSRETAGGTAADTEPAGNRGRFLESKVTLPQEIENIVAFQVLADQTLEVIGAAADYETFILKSSDGGENWETIPAGIADYSTAAIADDGTAAFVSYAENGICTIRLIDAQGNSSDISVEMTQMEDGSDNFIFGAAFDSKKQLIVRDLTGEIYAVNIADGSRSNAFETDNAWISYFDVVGTKCITVAEAGVSILDTETGEKLEDNTVLTELTVSNSTLTYKASTMGMPMVFAPAEDENGIVFADYQGVYHYTFGGTVSELLISGEQTSFGNTGASFFGIGMAGEQHIFAAADNGMESALYCYTYDADASATPSEELNIYALEDTDTLRQAVNIFRQKNPDVYVNLEIGMTGGDGITLEDALSSLSTDIMAGKGPDVLILDGMPVERYVEKGILKDISDVVAEVEQAEGLLDPVVENSRDGDCIYAIPTRILVSLVNGSEDAVNAGKTLKDMADYVKKLGEEKKTEFIMQPHTAKNLLMDYYHADSAGWRREDGSLDEEKLSDYLVQTKNIYDADSGAAVEGAEDFPESGIDSGYRYGSLDTFGMIQKTYAIGIGTVANISDFQILVSADRQIGAQFGLFNTAENTAYVPFLQAGVVAGGNEDAGKEFVKILLGKESGASDNGIPVNETALKASMEKLMEPTETAMSFGAAGSDEVYSLEYVSLTQEDVDYVMDLLESVEKPALTDAVILNLVTEQGVKYVKGEQSLEDTVNTIMKKVNLYFAE